MQYFSDARIDYFIAEDLPHIDLTCKVLGISDEQGEMEYFTREDCVIAGVEVVRRMMSKLGCEVVSARSDGDRVAAGETFMVVAARRRAFMRRGRCASTCSTIFRPSPRRPAPWWTPRILRTRVARSSPRERA